MDDSELRKFQNLSGVPGSGKTRTLTALITEAARRVGPEQVGAITYTRTAAEELRQRVADALGIQGDQRTLRRRLPWVGTIHSLAMGLAGIATKHVVDGKKLRTFSSEYTGGDAPVYDDMEAFFLDEPGLRTDAISAMRWISSAARHRMWPPEDVLSLVDARVLGKIGPERLLDLVKEYEEWKHEQGYYDFEDMLELGQRAELPVRFLAVDEAQDNSVLLWKVVNSWGNRERIQSYVTAGDPFQALFQFSGASPHLFMERPGRWHRLLTSHRFQQGDCDYARQIVQNVFGEPAGFLATWRGTGASPADGSSFYLARTGSLVSRKASELLESGVPFRYLRGARGPLTTGAADAYRTILKLNRGDLVGRDELLNLAEQTNAPKAAITPIRRLPDGYYGRGTAEAHLPAPSVGVDAELEYGDYYREVVRLHGEQAMFRTPKLQLGTVHAAKGREADDVIACTSWATKPAQNIIRDPESESCVAYVLSTRHRNSLTLEDVLDGGRRYPFPER